MNRTGFDGGSRPGQTTLRFRYAGTSTAPTQVAGDGTGAAIRNVAVGPEGSVLEDWLGTSRRLYGTNGHHDTSWTADDTGAVTATLRYDPWGSVLRSSGSLPDWRFQGSWADGTTILAWSIARWYDPVLGSFVSADTLLGQPETPASRQRYAYAEGDPVDGWDPSGYGKAELGFGLSEIRLRPASRVFGIERESASIISAPGKYTGRTATRLRPVRTWTHVHAEEFSWEGGHNVIAGVAEHRITVWMYLKNVTTGRTLKTWTLIDYNQRCFGGVNFAVWCEPPEWSDNLSWHRSMLPTAR